MKHQLRVIESVTVLLTSQFCDFDTSEFPNYNGSPEDETSFGEHIAGLIRDNNFEGLSKDTVSKLDILIDSDMTEYSNSADNGSNKSLEIGEEDFYHSKTGGFNASVTIKI
jgi:hypothetical protein